HQIVERGELDRANGGEPLERARLADIIEEFAFGDEDDLDIEQGCQRREVVRGEQCRQRHRNELFGVDRAPKRDNHAGWWSHWLSGLTKPGIRLHPASSPPPALPTKHIVLDRPTPPSVSALAVNRPARFGRRTEHQRLRPP